MGSACANAKQNQISVPKINITSPVDKPIVLKQSLTSKGSEPETNKVSIRTSLTIDDQPQKKLQSRSTLSQEEIQKQLNVKQNPDNPGREALRAQRKFIQDKFLQDLEAIEKNVKTDVEQMLKNFLSHLDSSPIYWTKVWLISKNDSSIVVGYQTNVCDQKKVRIMYTKQIECMSNILDNYNKFMQFNSYNIVDFHFRFNRKFLNYYVFSEQEYLEQCVANEQLDINDIPPLLKYLIDVLSQMHSQNYEKILFRIHPRNLFLYLDEKCKRQFKLDISLSAIRFNRRSQSQKDLRIDKIKDVDDITMLILSMFFKQQEFDKIKEKINQNYRVDFQQIINTVYQGRNDVNEQHIKDILILMRSQKQFMYDLQAIDFKEFLNPKVASSQIQISSNNNHLYHYDGCFVYFYSLVGIRAQKAMTQYLLVNPDKEPIKIIPGTTFINDNYLYFAYENMIGMVEIKLITEQIEDTLEIVITSLKMVYAGLDNKKDRADSAQQKVQLLIDPDSPQNQQIDKFQFNESEISKNTTIRNQNRRFHDRTFFTTTILADIFNMMKKENQLTIDAKEFCDFLNSNNVYVDKSLLDILTIEKIKELFNFLSDGRLGLYEFQQMFKYRGKSPNNYFTKVVKPQKFAQNIQSFTIHNNQVIFYDGNYIHTDSESFEINYQLMKLLKSENSVQLIGRQQGYLYLTNLQNCSTLTKIQVPEQFGFQRLNNNYAILCENKLIIYNLKPESYLEIEIPGLKVTSNIIVKDNLIMFIDDRYLYKTFFSGFYYANTKSDIVQKLQEYARYNTKLTIKTINSNSQTEDQIGSYSIQQVLYPTQTQQPQQFRVLQAIKAQQKYIIVQRVVHGEIESFDDCYVICKYLDNMLVNFFITQEFDGRVRLNYVFHYGEPLDSKNASWLIIKRAMKELYKLRQASIFVQEMHPNNIIVYPGQKILFTTLIYKTNVVSVFNEKTFPVVGLLDYYDPQTFKGALTNCFQNQIFINPNKTNVYNFGMIILRALTQYKINNTKVQEHYLMEISQALQKLPNEQSFIKQILEECLKEKDDQRQDCLGILQLIRRIEEKMYRDIYFPLTFNQFSLYPQNEISLAISENNLYMVEKGQIEIQQNFLQQTVDILGYHNYQKKMYLIVKQNQLVKLFIIKLSTLARRDSKELVNFQQYDEEEQVPVNQQLQVNYESLIKPSNDVFKEIEIPVFEMQDISECTTFYSGDDLYIFGGTNAHTKLDITDCFVFIEKRNLFKKICTRNSYYNCQVIELSESFILLEQKVNQIMRIQTITKNPIKCYERTIKIAANTQFLYFHHHSNILAFSCSMMVGWLINSENFKILKLKTETQHKKIDPIGIGNMSIITKESIITLQIVENSQLLII